MTTLFAACDVKRTLEMWASGLFGEAFRQAALAGAAPADQRAIIPEVADALVMGRPLVEEPALAEYVAFQKGLLVWRDSIRLESAPSHSLFRRWRERQIRRSMMEIGESQNSRITHIPAGFELSKGCSVNCWFCSMNAGPLKKVFRYTPKNAALWRDVLQALRNVIGPAAAWSSSYWATEPLDNPDYEAFCLDFHCLNGKYPQTTTSVPLRNVERTRRLLVNSFQRGCLINRFSVHTAEAFRGILAAFTPEELAFTELLLENPESANPFARVGRLFGVDRIDPELAASEDDKLRSLLKNAAQPDAAARLDRAVVNSSYLNENAVCANEGQSEITVNIPSSTSCMTGFLVNMPERTVELISPCAADADWPKGYLIFDQGIFTDAHSFESLLERMIADNMKERITPGDRVALTRRANFSLTEDGFALSTVFGRVGYERKGIAPFLAHLGTLLKTGDSRAGEIAIECFYLFGMNEALTMGFINDLFDKGLLDQKTVAAGNSGKMQLAERQ